MTGTAFARECARLGDILCAVNLLSWDARTHMPTAASAVRGQQIATLTELAHDCATGARMRDAIEAVRADPAADAGERALARDFARRIDILARIPTELVVEMAALRMTANAAWIAAREGEDFDLFRPSLMRIFAIQRLLADAIGWSAHPYDALLDQYEEAMTLAELRPLLETLRADIAPLLDAVRDVRPLPMPALSAERQKALAATFASLVGFDFSRGRLDETLHPFELSLTRDDVRITSRFRPDQPLGGLHAALHEAGHGIYEQGVDPRWTRSAAAIDVLNLYAVGGRSFGLHESQSRLYENRLGRSRPFWERHAGLLRDAFGADGNGLTAERVWRTLNAPAPGPIRVEADELTYDAHIALRVEIEAALIAGEIGARDLPGLWNERMLADLGVVVPDLRHGVLQDVHWSCGYVGSFATYTIGNVMASQFFAAASRDAAVADGIAAGDYASLRDWLGTHVHRHGRSRDRARILRDATGESLDPTCYLADLRAKAAALAAAPA